MEDTGPGNGKNAGWYEAGMPGVLAQLLPLGRLPGSLAQLLPLGQLPGSLARGICQAWVSGSLGGHLDGAWVSGSVYLEKVPAFFDFAGTFFDAKPIEAHRGSFHCAIWLDAGTFDSKISYRPANKLTDADRNCLSPCFQHWFRTQQAYFTKYSLINPST